MSISSGIFYGVQKFKIAALIGVLYPTLKIIVCCTLVLLGMEVLGATLGILLAASIVVFYAAFQIFQFPIERNGDLVEVESLEIKKILMMLLANTLFAFMIQMDIIVVNHFFGPEEGGFYASAATLGKSVLFLPGGVAVALLATAGSDQFKKKYDHQTLTYAIALTAICCLVLASLMYLFSELIIKITFGDSYWQASKLLGIYAFAMCPWALVLVLENYLIALDKYFLTWVYLLGMIIQCISIYYFHSDPFSILYIVGFVGVITSIIGLVFAWIEFGLSIKMKFFKSSL
jgi:O-antigen/teichoic acid export membrane protein